MLLLADCKFNLAKTYANLDGLNNSSNAENFFNDSIELFEKVFNGSLNAKILNSKEELVKFYLKQDRYEVMSNAKIFTQFDVVNQVSIVSRIASLYWTV